MYVHTFLMSDFLVFILKDFHSLNKIQKLEGNKIISNPSVQNWFKVFMNTDLSFATIVDYNVFKK